MKLKNWLFTTFIGLAMLSFAASVVPQVTSFKVFDDGVFISRLVEINCAGDLACTENLSTGKIDFTATASGAPADALYVTLALDATLTAERVLTGTANQITLTDGGANTTITLSTPQDIHTGASPTFAALSLNNATNQIVLDPDEGSCFTGTITDAVLSAARIWTFPNAAGTVVLGSGSANSVPVWTSANVLGESTFTDNGSLVHFNFDNDNIDFRVDVENGLAFFVDADANIATFSQPQGYANTAVALGAAAVTFSAATNHVTVTGDAGTNTIATITSGTVGEIGTFLFVDGLVTITDNDAHAANSIDLDAPFTSADDVVLTLLYDGTSWYEIGRSTSGSAPSGSGTLNTLPIWTSATTLGDSPITHGVSSPGFLDLDPTTKIRFLKPLRFVSAFIENNMQFDKGSPKNIGKVTEDADTSATSIGFLGGTGGVASATGGGDGGDVGITAGLGGAGTAGLFAGAGGDIPITGGAAGTDNGGCGAVGGSV